MRSRLPRLIPAILALLAPTAAFCGHASIVVTTPPVALAWDQPAVVFASPVVVPRVIVTVTPPWAVHTPHPPLHHRWHGHHHGYGHRHHHGYRHDHGYRQGHGHRAVHPYHRGPDRHGWR